MDPGRPPALHLAPLPGSSHPSSCPASAMDEQDILSNSVWEDYRPSPPASSNIHVSLHSVDSGSQIFGEPPLPSSSQGLNESASAADGAVFASTEDLAEPSTIARRAESFSAFQTDQPEASVFSSSASLVEPQSIQHRTESLSAFVVDDQPAHPGNGMQAVASVFDSNEELVDHQSASVLKSESLSAFAGQPSEAIYESTEDLKDLPPDHQSSESLSAFATGADARTSAFSSTHDLVEPTTIATLTETFSAFDLARSSDNVFDSTTSLPEPAGASRTDSFSAFDVSKDQPVFASTQSLRERDPSPAPIFDDPLQAFSTTAAAKYHPQADPWIRDDALLDDPLSAHTLGSNADRHSPTNPSSHITAGLDKLLDPLRSSVVDSPLHLHSGASGEPARAIPATGQLHGARLSEGREQHGVPSSFVSDAASITPIAPSDRDGRRSEDDVSVHETDPLGINTRAAKFVYDDSFYAHASSTARAPGPKDPPRSAYGDTAIPQEASPKRPDGNGYSYEVSVGEPQKVGDAINPHMIYKVRTKTNDPAFRNAEFSVSRRYRDFLWLYNQLVNRYPGAIVPPVPEKHALGRFQDELVEMRRSSFERSLRKMVNHSILQNDQDLRIFLESETFVHDVTQKKREESKGFMGFLGDAMTNASQTFVKYVEVDQWFEDKKRQLDILETQLRSMSRALEALVKQRKEIGAAMSEYGESFASVSKIDSSRPISHNILLIGNIYKQVKEIYDRQAKHDINHLVIVVEEYILTMGSVKTAFAARSRAYSHWQTFEQQYYRKQDALEKQRGASKLRSDKIQQAQSELLEVEKQTRQAKTEFETISARLRAELEYLDQEKIADFAQALRLYLRSLLESHQEIQRLWESYFASAVPI
ncbi:Vps5 C terminal like-domain-containing protein [Polychytrium aggregatum]|uniref:Vps5 C terminal like-domain-containing protein n=1 Tax=Polychytrium aggregatum TaxID=110093 RepID=UPI0022FDB222|nr:Vps5 C terminal like-domain-containing protein [Polychytrium aggregatum]KAI9199367.1 Vps5 C terminal like-domain-containing protein [Polychytrium aggregatum]